MRRILFNEVIMMVNMTEWMQGFLHLKNGGAVNFAAMSETLFQWAKDLINE